MNDNRGNDGWRHISEFINDELFEYLERQEKLKQDLSNAKNYYQILLSIKSYYLQHEQGIIETFRQSKYLWHSSYPIDWFNFLTPIEFMAWSSIRIKGRIVMYPQYPVDRCFIDFANPGLKIGLEIDGAQYHDKEKDLLRDQALRAKGWVIFRISGKEMNKTDFTTFAELDYYNTPEEEFYELLSYWLLETGDGVIEAVKQIYFEKPHADEYVSENYKKAHCIFISLCVKTLDKHLSIK